MADFPYLPLYWKDWLTGQATLMTPEQKGAFVDLLCHSWGQDPPCTLPDDVAALARLSGLGARWKKVGAAVRAAFEPVPDQPGRIRNAKLWSVWQEMQERSDRRRRAGAKGNAVRWDSQEPRKPVASESQSDRNATPNAIANGVANPIANRSPSVAVAVPENRSSPEDSVVEKEIVTAAASPLTPLQPVTERHRQHQEEVSIEKLDMRTDLSKAMDSVPDPNTRHRVEAMAGPIIDGDATTCWRDPRGDGGQIPLQERPRLLRLALSKFQSDGWIGTLDGCLRYVAKRELTPFGPAEGSPAAQYRNGDPKPADRGGHRADLEPAMAARREEERSIEADRLELAKWAKQHPDEAEAIRVDVVNEIAAEEEAKPPSKRLSETILRTLGDAKYRKALRERMEAVAR